MTLLDVIPNRSSEKGEVEKGRGRVPHRIQIFLLSFQAWFRDIPCRASPGNHLLHSPDQLRKGGSGRKQDDGENSQTRFNDPIPQNPEAALRYGKTSKA